MESIRRAKNDVICICQTRFSRFGSDAIARGKRRRGGGDGGEEIYGAEAGSRRRRGEWREFGDEREGGNERRKKDWDRGERAVGEGEEEGERGKRTRNEDNEELLRCWMWVIGGRYGG